MNNCLLETNDLRSVISSFSYTHFKNKDLENEGAKDVFTRAFQNNNAGKIQKFENWMKENQDDKNYFLTK